MSNCSCNKQLNGCFCEIESNLIRCGNSKNGKHEWRENIGKNAKKPKMCVLCNNFYDSLVLMPERIKNRGNNHVES